MGSAGVCIRSINEVSRIVGIPSSEVMCRSSGRCRSKVRLLAAAPCVEDEVGNGTSSSSSLDEDVAEDEDGLMFLTVADEDEGADDEDVDGIGILPACCNCCWPSNS